jgi:Galactose oxidase, central domain
MAATLGQAKQSNQEQVLSTPTPSNLNSSPSQSVEELDVFGDIPQARFGHTITLVSKTKVVLFGGATGDTGKYSMTGETYLFNILSKTWSKLNGTILRFNFSQGSPAFAQSCSFFHQCRTDADGCLWRSHWR